MYISSQENPKRKSNEREIVQPDSKNYCKITVVKTV